MCGVMSEVGPCRVEGKHALHVAGFGSKLTTWPNEEFVPPPSKLSRTDVIEAAQQIAAAQG
jgi:hypothetical protein